MNKAMEESSMGRAAGRSERESPSAMGSGEGGRGGATSDVSCSCAEDARDKSTDASDRLSADEASSKGAADGTEAGDATGKGEGSGGKEGEASKGWSGGSPRAGRGAEGTWTGKSGRGTDVPRASGCRGENQPECG